MGKGDNVKGRGIREERETVIRWDEAGDTANIWTASESVYKQLKKRGYFPVEDHEDSATFEVPKKFIRIRKPKVPSEKQRAVLYKLSEAGKNTRFWSSSRHRNGVSAT